MKVNNVVFIPSRKKPIQKIIILCNALVHLQYWTSISAKDHNMNNLDFMCMLCTYYKTYCYDIIWF